ncbi:MAG: flagellar biosynthesis protein FlhF [Rhodoferax sp.]|nr:flagellar biosynthesis protein FlhF [Rhodoferax sp.]
MNIQRFNAPTARDALAKARMAFGDGTLILSNRPTATGVEVVATAEDSLAALDQADSFTKRAKDQDSVRPAPAPRRANPKNQVEDDVAELAMSTLSFQDYVRERMLRRRQEAVAGKTAAPVVAPVAAPEPAQPITVASAPAAPRRLQLETPAKPKASAPERTSPMAASAPALSQGIVDELRNMKALIEERFDTLSWLGQARQHPIQSNLMLKLIRAGYSPMLARAILEKMPEETGAAEAVHWVMDVLQRNLKTDAGGAAIHQEGGIYALVGATGVGKTTTAAKLAGLCARTHGPSSVGLITLDTYRVGAHEQLRTYGRMMGVVAHLAHDRAALQDLLNLLAAKKMVLIDTTGLAPHDPRKRDMLDVLDLPKVNRLQVLNAGGHGDTLEDVVSSFKSKGVQQAVLSKIDEAAKLGPVLDAAIRHQLVLRGVTTGQRVPEDWEAADASKLVRMSMRSPARSAFDPTMADMGFFFAQSSAGAHHGGHLDA